MKKFQIDFTTKVYKTIDVDMPDNADCFEAVDAFERGRFDLSTATITDQSSTGVVYGVRPVITTEIIKSVDLTVAEITALIMSVNISDRVDKNNPDTLAWLTALGKLLIASFEAGDRR